MSRERDLVFAAVQQGVGSLEAIATWTGVPSGRVRTELGRLSDAKKVRRNGLLWELAPPPAPVRGRPRLVRLMS